jgi:hypothetical protein
MKNRLAISKQIRKGIVKNHWVILSLVLVGVIAFGVFKHQHAKSSLTPEIEICEILYHVE